MKHKLLLLAWIIAITTTSGSGCKKNKLSELEKLPPATQTGAKTFGCLVNGKAWIPAKEDWFSTSALRFYYYTDNGGQFAINAEYQNSPQNRNEAVVMGCDSILSKNIYVLKNNSTNIARVLFRNTKNFSTCRSVSSMDNDAETTGIIKITKLDLINGIVSGTFEFTIKKPGCETITITHGRFDAKL
ncbi:MAG: hypothetical protein K2Q24_14215 [Chitinophagaceae bacterium]|nr:hypothetical protein [Chitinophagaceae bacterium]